MLSTSDDEEFFGVLMLLVRTVLVDSIPTLLSSVVVRLNPTMYGYTVDCVDCNVPGRVVQVLRAYYTSQLCLSYSTVCTSGYS